MPEALIESIRDPFGHVSLVSAYCDETIARKVSRSTKKLKESPRTSSPPESQQKMAVDVHNIPKLFVQLSVSLSYSIKFQFYKIGSRMGVVCFLSSDG